MNIHKGIVIELRDVVFFKKIFLYKREKETSSNNRIFESKIDNHQVVEKLRNNKKAKVFLIYMIKKMN